MGAKSLRRVLQLRSFGLEARHELDGELDRLVDSHTGGHGDRQVVTSEGCNGTGEYLQRAPEHLLVQRRHLTNEIEADRNEHDAYALPWLEDLRGSWIDAYVCCSYSRG